MLDNEIINIISVSAKTPKVGGPNKVLINACKGFDRIGQKYVINKNPENYCYNWVHDSIAGLIKIAVFKIPAVIGPNIVVLPKDLPWFLPTLNKCIYIHPSTWCVNVWRVLKFKLCELRSWPVGIDWEHFTCERSFESEKNVMLYIKNQPTSLANIALKYIELKGFKAQIVRYGTYMEDEFKRVLQNSHFGIWIGTTESQGIALLEALASDLPLIVLNNTKVSNSSGTKLYRFPKEMDNLTATTIPYFDKSCGIIIDNIEDLGTAIEEMFNSIGKFTPQSYIRNNLSLEICTQKLLQLFQDLDINHLERNTGNIPRISRLYRGLWSYFIFLLYNLRRKVKAIINILIKVINT
jgi:hypothetical protein